MASILVVDDEEAIRSVVKRLLTLHGHAVDTANDGGAAVDQLQKKDYALMIIDRNMPSLNGIEAVAMVRSSPKYKDLKILMFTGDTVTKDVDEAFEAGVDGYIGKPLDMARLVEKIDKVLGKTK